MLPDKLLRTMFFHLSKANNMETLSDRVAYLSANVPLNILRVYFSVMFDPEVKWSLPEGDPPFKPLPEEWRTEGMFYKIAQKFWRFEERHDPNLPKHGREKLFISFLETVHPDDAKLLLAMKDRKNLFPNVGLEVAKHFFPPDTPWLKEAA